MHRWHAIALILFFFTACVNSSFEDNYHYVEIEVLDEIEVLENEASLSVIQTSSPEEPVHVSAILEDPYLEGLDLAYGYLECTEEYEIAFSRFKIAIDPGHQERGNYNREPIGPGASEYKARVASGTRGVSTAVPEYQLVLYISLKLRDELQSRGFDVFMVRETHDVDISNSERAIMASESGADIFVRIHANGSQNRDVHGIMTLSSSMNNPFIPHLYEQSRALSEYILDAMLDATGAGNLGVIEVDNMTGSNWSTIPVSIVEMGFMTNPREDELMQTAEYQEKLVIGMANGIEGYFLEWGGK